MLAFLNMELCPRPNITGTSASKARRRGTIWDGLRGSDHATKRGGQKGAGNLKAIVWTMILVAFIYAAVVVLPVLISEYEFQDSLQSIARFASVSHKSSDQIKKDVLDEAQKEDLPVQAEDIKVNGVSGNVHITVDYSVTVDLKVYQWTLNFHPAADNSAIL